MSLAANLLDLPTSNIEPFDVLDAFNNDQRIEGFISRQADHRYGALVIMRVANEETTPQIVYGTPKMHYPFEAKPDGTRAYHFPSVVREVSVYQKLDGTNILAYGYKDADGKRFLTYKTRLNPVLGDNKFGPFRQMWQEMLASTPDLRSLCRFWALREYEPDTTNLSFELYGYRNRHLILYPEALAVRLLFGVGAHDAEVVPPLVFTDDQIALRPVATLHSAEGLVAFYEKLRADADATNKKVVDGDTEAIDGTEGYVFYVLDGENRWHQTKCKPEGVEQIHWATDVIPIDRIMPTTWNSLEAADIPTVEAVRTLLLEEFSQAQIDASAARIEKAVDVVTGQLAWRGIVKEAFDAETVAMGPLVALNDKATVMRLMANHFHKAEMKRVYSALRAMGLVT